MAVTNYQLGSLNPVVYFENRKGEIWLPPSTEQALAIKDQMRARGFELKEAGNIPAIDELSKRIYEIERRKMESRRIVEETMYDRMQDRVRSSMLQRAVSSSTSPFERDFLMYYMQVRMPEKKKKFMEQFEHRQMYFEAREHDNGNAFLDMADKSPDMKDEQCRDCGKYRRIKKSEYCARCSVKRGERLIQLVG